jgi:hypothetical protein
MPDSPCKRSSHRWQPIPVCSDKRRYDSRARRLVIADPLRVVASPAVATQIWLAIRHLAASGVRYLSGVWHQRRYLL